MTLLDVLEVLSEEEKTEIIDHMNSDHADAVLTYVHFFGDREMALSASLTSVTEERMHISMICDDGNGGRTEEEASNIKRSNPRRLSRNFRFLCNKPPQKPLWGGHLAVRLFLWRPND